MISILISLDETTLENYDKDGTGETVNYVTLYGGKAHIHLAGVCYIAEDVKAAAKLFADYAQQLDRLASLVEYSKAHPGQSVFAHKLIHAQTDLSEVSVATAELERTYDPQDEIAIPENELIADPTQEEPF